MRLTGPSNVQSNTMLVVSHLKRGLESRVILDAAALPTSVSSSPPRPPPRPAPAARAPPAAGAPAAGAAGAPAAGAAGAPAAGVAGAPAAGAAGAPAAGAAGAPAAGAAGAAPAARAPPCRAAAGAAGSGRSPIWLSGTRPPPVPRGSRITTCSGAQSPEMFGSPLRRRASRFAVLGALTCPLTSWILPPAFTYWP